MQQRRKGYNPEARAGTTREAHGQDGVRADTPGRYRFFLRDDPGVVAEGCLVRVDGVTTDEEDGLAMVLDRVPDQVVADWTRKWSAGWRILPHGTEVRIGESLALLVEALRRDEEVGRRTPPPATEEQVAHAKKVAADVAAMREAGTLTSREMAWGCTPKQWSRRGG
jgi:hypothetical protein